uniref:Uncharacterized protein n=1 Tax=Cacopsylla melanoneura TaxID=428564 RepID=A0A8D8T565_9HEMI
MTMMCNYYVLGLVPFKSKTIPSRAELAKYVLDQDTNSLVILSTREHCKSLNGPCLDQIGSEEIISIAEDSFDFEPGKNKKSPVQTDQVRRYSLENTWSGTPTCSKTRLPSNVDQKL